MKLKRAGQPHTESDSDGRQGSAHAHHRIDRHRAGVRRLARSLLAGTLALGILAGCASNDSLTQQYRQGDEKGYIAGDFQVVEIPESGRGEAVVFEGVTETGEAVSSDDYRGEVLVVNFWYAACGPCIVEAPLLEQVWQESKDEDVSFLGVNTYDQPATALSFAKDNGVTYPSVIDVVDGRVKLAFAQVTPIQATPTTLVIDRQGRVAARIIGQLASASILSTLVSDALDEDSP